MTAICRWPGARAECDRVITTIFVNPKQFNNPEDLKKYPRTERRMRPCWHGAGGCDLCAAGRGGLPRGLHHHVTMAGVAQPLEGHMRPGHFDGVATVVTKLFGMTLADRGYFGQKDWQQLQVVLRLVRDLNIPVEVVGCETIREADGLAMSSRNVRLTPEGRARAPVLYAAITRPPSDIRAGHADRMAIREAAEAMRAAGFERVEYIELRDAETLMPSDDPPTRPRRMLAAAWLDGSGAADRQHPGLICAAVLGHLRIEGQIGMARRREAGCCVREGQRPVGDAAGVTVAGLERAEPGIKAALRGEGQDNAAGGQRSEGQRAKGPHRSPIHGHLREAPEKSPRLQPLQRADQLGVAEPVLSLDLHAKQVEAAAQKVFLTPDRAVPGLAHRGEIVEADDQPLAPARQPGQDMVLQFQEKASGLGRTLPLQREGIARGQHRRGVVVLVILVGSVRHASAFSGAG
jgi:pantoate--beta-alanine ligase